MRFHAKRTTIKESTDLNTYKLEQLIRSLQTYKLELPDSKKMKNITLEVVKEEENDDFIEDLFEDELVGLTMQIRRFLKSQNSKGHEQRTNSDSNSRNFRSLDVSHDKASRSFRTSEHRSSNNKCANIVKRKEKKNKAMNVTWSNNDSASASAFENEKEVIALVGIVDGYDIEVLRKYSDLYDIAMQVKKDNSNLRKKLALVESKKKEVEAKHQSQIDIEEKLQESMLEKLHMLTSDKKSLEDELIEMKNKVEEFNICSEKMDKMLSYGKS
ncbi:hypothetical protein D8674_039165 [Pyrus ussuriensis x Pyrus communis]|uniref:Uncharacterized protein n=1 Tax=Pyrus ussuriensis x Pyrus communis TaxID=2448454 RepID=A0A5N5I421_9ROSA|nr:hypothetical protein D8674_039207 [Pyrus ussuriensis x Pyrus communis]KAB2634549.1 hypothetical protein D8674_039165 [Pyrus ussuriensis x Pyrus communis]